MFNIFGWLRTKAAEAVVLGVEDGMKLVTEGGDAPPDLAALRARLAAAVLPPALPAASLPAEAVDAAAEVATGGRRKRAAG